jgi:hypothetical protein
LGEPQILGQLKSADPKMIAIMESRGLPVKTELDRWQSLMDLY